MKIIYTESGKQALESYQKKMVAELEEKIKQRKYVLGDDLIEVTASDINEISDGRYPDGIYRLRRFSYQKTILQLYMVLGILSTIAGLFYDQIKELLFDRPEQLIFVVSGIAFTVLSAVMLARIRMREIEEEKLTYISKRSIKESDRDA